MPAALRSIEESAFEGMTLLHVVDAGSVTAIGKWAFKDTGLTQIKLPQNCFIDADAFTGCGTVYVFAPAGGTTESWCRSRTGIVFVAEYRRIGLTQQNQFTSVIASDQLQTGLAMTGLTDESRYRDLARPIPFQT